MNRIIKISCDGCNTSYDVTRDREAPTTAISMGCNWCPECEGEADDILKPNMAIRRTNYALTSCTT